MSETRYVKATKNWALFGTVAASGVADDYLGGWAVDGRPGFPIAFSGGSATIQISNTSALVDTIAICHHTLDAGLVVGVSGDVTGSILIPDHPANAVPYNGWTQVALAAVSSITLTITGNSRPVVIGEIVAGQSMVLDPRLMFSTARFGVERYVADRENPLSGIPPYSDRAHDRLLSGSQYYTAAQLREIMDWYDSHDAYAYPVPSLLIQDTADVADARLVMMQPPSYEPYAGSEMHYLVSLDFAELPRTRW